jgi:hypothetical protein
MGLMTDVLVGSKGYLFLDNDTNNVQLQTSGVPFMTEERLDAIAESHRQAAERATERGGRYLHIIAPNKETACREFLPTPGYYQSLGKTPANLFKVNPDWHRSTYFHDSIVSGHYSKHTYYDADESHWSTHGALTYLQVAFNQFGWIGERDRLRSVGVDVDTVSSLGDLAAMIEMPPRVRCKLSVRSPQAQARFRGRVSNEGCVRHFICGRGAGRALIYHDSFLTAPLSFLTEIYKETLTVHCPDFLTDVEEGYQPDVVIKLQAERFFPYIPKAVSMNDWLTAVELRKNVRCFAERDYLGSLLRPHMLAAE